jgi:hypothetical protein
VVALISRNGHDSQAAYWATEVDPPLTLTATRASHGGKASVTLKVTDAGAAVRGATVRFCGKHFATPASGQVTFKVASIGHGSSRATAAKSGYAGAAITVKATC